MCCLFIYICIDLYYFVSELHCYLNILKQRLYVHFTLVFLYIILIPSFDILENSYSTIIS
jgi:hypothetical protein